MVSAACNLGPTDTNGTDGTDGTDDVYLHDLATGSMASRSTPKMGVGVTWVQSSSCLPREIIRSMSPFGVSGLGALPVAPDALGTMHIAFASVRVERGLSWERLTSGGGAEGVAPVQLVVPMRRNGPVWPSRWRRRWPKHAAQMVQALADVVTWIGTERLVLRRVTPDDAGGLASTIDEVVLAANGWTAQQAAAVLAEAAELAARGQVGARAVITDRATGEILGEIGFSNLDVGRCSCEIGWWTGPAARGQGYGTEAAAALVGALHAAGVRRVWIGTSPANVAVQRTAAKIGARLADKGRLRLPDGTVTASLWFAHDG